MAYDKLLVLDLDETLIFATEQPLSRAPAFFVGPYAVYERPGVGQFLAFCVAAFERVAIWTASTADYAAEVVAHRVALDRLELLWARDRCTFHIDGETRDGVYLKDIKKLRRRGYDAAKIIFVDDSPSKLRRSYGNLVAVSWFEGDEADRELVGLARYLDTLGRVDDVRTIEKRGWRRGLVSG